MGYVQEHGFIVCYAVGAVAEGLKDVVIAELGQLFAFLTQAAGHGFGIGATDLSSGIVEVLDIGGQLLTKLLVVVAESGDASSALRTDDGGEGQAREGAIGESLAEVVLSGGDGGGGIEAEP